MTIYSYDATSDNWSQLPDFVHEKGSIAVINGLLTTVGGRSYPSSESTFYSNELFTLTGEGSHRRWTKVFPPMPTKRAETAAVCTRTTLIVAGGLGVGGVLSTVEVMNTETHHASGPLLLIYLNQRTGHQQRNQLCMLGGFDKQYSYSKFMYTCSLGDFLQPVSSSASQCHISKSNQASVWRRVADLPVIRSTCESFHGRLLAVGGYNNDSSKHSTDVYMYNPTTNSWEIISHMTTGRSGCFTAVLPDNQLMVVGGNTSCGSIATIEVAT